MDRVNVVEDLKRCCTCYFDVVGGELWKCAPCEARDYIQLLTARLNEIGCKECDAQIKEILG